MVAAFTQLRLARTHVANMRCPGNVITTPLAVPYEVVRDVTGTFCKLDILLVVTYLGTLHRNSLSNVSFWAPVKTEVSCTIIVPMNIG